MDEQELVPRHARLERARRRQRGREETGQRRLREADRVDDEVRGHDAAGAGGAMAVRETDREEVVRRLVCDGRLRRLAQPASEAVLAPLDARGVGRAVGAEEESRGLRKFQEVIVERGRQLGLALEYDGRTGAYGRG